jgi:hypothetical protein
MIQKKELIHLGVDLGAGAIKIHGSDGGVQVISQVANNGSSEIGTMLGLKSAKAVDMPYHVESDFGSFYVGHGAHKEGRPISNMDFERFSGSPEMRAIMYASLAKYQKEYGRFDAPLIATVGLPLQMMMGDDALRHKKNIKEWMKGHHSFKVDGILYNTEIERAQLTSQPIGALHRYTHSEYGEIIPEHKDALEDEVGIISIGFNTIELLVIQGQQAFKRFTKGETMGVRRLLELCDPKDLYTPAERDERLRSGKYKSELKVAMPIWENDVEGAINSKWDDKTYKRFAKIPAVGGGVYLLKDMLVRKFGTQVWFPPDPVMAIAEGLYRLALTL